MLIDLKIGKFDHGDIGQLKELKDSVKMLGSVINYKALTNVESTWLLKIISDYAYALDILDQYDYENLWPFVGRSWTTEFFLCGLPDSKEEECFRMVWFTRNKEQF